MKFLKLPTFINLGIRQQLILTFSVGIACFAMTSSLILWSMSSQSLYLQLREQGEQITDAFAKQSTLSLLYQSVENARDSAAATIGFPDVVGVSIYSLDNKILYSEGLIIDTPQHKGALTTAQNTLTETRDVWNFSAPVYAGNLSDDEESPFLTHLSTKELVGSVEVVMSKRTLNEMSMNIFRTNLLIAACLAFVFVLILLAITSRIIRPLKALSEDMRRAQNGEANVRAALTGPSDIVHMEFAFNTMMRELETRQKQLEVARDSALAAAHAKGEFAACVSHELRTPMNGVMGMLDLLKDMGLNAKQDEYIKIAQSSGDALLNLVDDVLDFSKLESTKMKLHPTEFCIENLVEDVVELLSNQAHNVGLSLRANIVGDIPALVKGDEGRIRQILINLVGNAIKFTPVGNVTITMSIEDNPDEHFRLRFSVRDTGIGIVEESQQKIFEAFTQADSSLTRQYGGTGLGLAICSQLVRLMGGELGLESAPGKGSDFWFVIPFSVVSQPKAALPVEQQGDIAGLRVLIANADTEELQELSQALLEWECFTRSSDNSEDVLSMLLKAKALGKPYDIVLTNASLRDMEGQALAKEIVAQAGSTRTAIIVLNMLPQDSHDYCHEQVAYLTRPLGPSKLKHAISQSMKQCKQVTKEIENPNKIESRRASLSLPPPQSVVPSAPINSESKVPTCENSILVVEDNRANQHVAKAMLERLGFVCDIVSNGAEALEALKEKTIDLILMDCHMPVMDGYACTQNIRQGKSAYQNITIIAMTANVDITARGRCLESGMDDYLPKPLQLESLKLKLQQWLSCREITAPPTDTDEQTGKLIEIRQEPVSAPPAVLNAKTIGELHKTTGRAFSLLLEVFLEDAPQHINALKQAVTAKDGEEIFLATHRVKGAAMSFGADQLTHVCRRLERQAKNGELTTTENTLQELQQSYGRLAAALLKEVDREKVDWNTPTHSSDKHHILVVDDERSTRMTLSSALKKEGFKVEECESGGQALEACARSMPDLVLMDALMPGVTGFEATRKINQMSHTILPPILMITSLQDEASIERAFEAGATDYIAKPVNISVLRRRVGRLLQSVEAEKNIHKLAYSDQLTGLPNRAQFAKRSGEILQNAQKNDSRFALLFIDLDDFKRVNDTQGHDIGDQLLKIAAKRIQQCMRTTDLLVRLGGDEFTVVLEDIQSVNIVSRVADKICKTLAQPFDFMQHQMRMPTSVGIALYPQDGENIRSLMKHADTAMFKAKACGGEHYQFYEYGMETEVARRVELERELRKALKNNELVLHYQPQVDAQTGAFVGTEALVRWQHPGRGFLPPSEFISIAEESGLIIPLGDWVMEESCRQLKEWLDAGINMDFMAVNVSNHQLQDKDFLRRLKLILEKTKIPPAKLKLEMTESAMADGSDDTITLLHDLKHLQIGLAIDDFGTGYSSLGYLKNFPVDTLKLDRSFIKDLPDDKNGAAIVSGIIALGHRLDMEIIAEGIETEEQRQYLVSENCDVMQGYLFSRPLPESECRQWIQHLHQTEVPS